MHVADCGAREAIVYNDLIYTCRTGAVWFDGTAP